MTTGLFWSLTPATIKSRLRDMHAPQTALVKAGSDELVEHYIRWSGVTDNRYDGVLPAHFFCKYGMSMVARITGMVPYNLMSVVNQGCRMQINSLIPRGEAIRLTGQLIDCSDDGSRVRIHSRVVAGTENEPEALIVDSMAAVMKGKPVKKKTASRSKKIAYETVGNWSAGRDAGQKFFFLTGDFNPIHTFWPVAKRTRFGGCILHGFGSYARTFETIQNAGYTIRDIDIRFTKPNLLPTPELNVQVAKKADSQGQHALRLTNPDGEALLAGHFSE